MKKLLLILTILLAAPAAFATSIVILVTPGYILIGSDSKRLFLNPGAQVARMETVNKIHAAGSYCFALAGMTEASNTRFSAARIISYHLQQKLPYEVAIAGIKRDIKTALLAELQYQRRRCPASFAQLTSGGGPLLEVAVVRVRNGVPQLELIGFSLDDCQRLQVGSYMASCPGDCPQEQQFYFMGSYGEMEQYLSVQSGERDPARLVEQMILAQSKATPGSVGAPVRMLRFTAGGMEWLK